MVIAATCSILPSDKWRGTPFNVGGGWKLWLRCDRAEVALYDAEDISEAKDYIAESARRAGRRCSKDLGARAVECCVAGVRVVVAAREYSPYRHAAELLSEYFDISVFQCSERVRREWCGDVLFSAGFGRQYVAIYKEPCVVCSVPTFRGPLTDYVDIAALCRLNYKRDDPHFDIKFDAYRAISRRFADGVICSPECEELLTLHLTTEIRKWLRHEKARRRKLQQLKEVKELTAKSRKAMRKNNREALESLGAEFKRVASSRP